MPDTEAPAESVVAVSDALPTAVTVPLPLPVQGREAPAAAAAPRAGTSADAANAQLDAQLELAAKKAALRSLEAQAAGAPVIADAPLPPGMPSGRIVIERDGKTIILENPTAEQLAAVGGVGSSVPQLEGWAVVAVTGMVVGTIIIVATLFLKHLRNRGRVHPAGTDVQAEARMARIENAIESIAVEVERISEGQRFTSRILSEGAVVPIVGAAQGERVMRANGEG